MKLVLAGLTIIGLCRFANAANFDEQKVAENLGTVLAAEEVCDLGYDQNAIQKYISDVVPADVTSFPGTLGLWTRTRKSQMREMSGSEKTAQCTSVANIARNLGFIK